MTSENRRTRFLQEMGLGPIWAVRERQEQGDAQSPLETPEPAIEQASPVSITPQIQNVDAAWSDPAPVMARAAGVNTAPSADEIAGMDWEQLKAAVSVCTKCRLCETRTQTVFGAGTPKAKWLFVGEGPGYNEDKQGEPFIGAAGKLLDNMMAALGLKRGVNAYIANVVKCRATDANGRDRPPAPDESAACLPYLERQIALIQPTVMVALGKTSALALLGLDPDTPVSKLRGTVHRHAGVPLVVTYHPAYLLRKLEDKGKAWRDLCLAMQTYADTSKQS